MQFVFDVDKSLWMTSNGRYHWAVRSSRTKTLREMAALKAWNLPTYDVPVRAIAYISYPRNGRADPANASATVKPLIDGLVDGGVLADDDHEHLLGPDYRRGEKTGETGLWRVRIVLEEA